MSTPFEIKRTIPATPQEIYDAWLSSDGHTAMTGGAANCSAEEGAAFTAWDGYISGKNLKLVPAKEIVQSWRTTDFAADDSDSELIVRLSPIDGGTELTLIHNDIPDGQPDYEQGWDDSYFKLMQAYFAEK